MSVEDELEPLLREAAAGDRASWNELLARYRDRLRRMVALRLDHRLQGRIDASDIVQEACLEADTRMQEYLARPAMPFFLWLRFLTGQKLITLHRHHFGAKMRDAGREVPLDYGGAPATTSAGLAAQIVGHDPRPSEIAIQLETQARFQAVLDGLEPLDREIIALRHHEQLSNAEAAHVLELQEAAASKRYIRAMRRLKEALGDWPQSGAETPA